jgi:hypothetical protein
LAAGPAISGPSAITINEDAGATNIDYTITDATVPAFAISTWATTSNESLVSIDNLSVLGLGKNRQLSFFPTANANGAATLTLFANLFGNISQHLVSGSVDVNLQVAYQIEIHGRVPALDARVRQRQPGLRIGPGACGDAG